MSNDAQVLLVKAHFTVALRQTADAVDQATNAASWCSSQVKPSVPNERVDVRVSWQWGSSLAGYKELSKEIGEIVEERFEEFVTEARLRLAARAARLCKEIGLVD